MTNLSMERIIVYVVIAIISITLIIGTQPRASYAPKGIALPITTPRPPKNINGVRHYSYLPTSAQPIAYINVQKHINHIDEFTSTQALKYALKLAGQVGANGLYLTLFQASPANLNSSQRVYLLKGIAFYDF